MSSHLKKVARRYAKHYRSIGSYGKRYFMEGFDSAGEIKISPMRYTFSEVKLSRVLNHAKEGNGFIVVSAFKGENPEHVDMKLHEKLKSYIKSIGLGYFVLDGHYVEKKGTPRESKVNELSLFIPYMKDVMSVGEFKELASFLREKYDQEGVLLKIPGNKNVFEVKKFKLINIGTFHPGKFGEYYSSVRGRPNQSFTFEGTQYPSNHISAGSFKRRNQLWY